MRDGEPLTINRSTPLDALPMLLRIEEAAAWADVSNGVLYDQIQRGAIKVARFGRLIRIPKSQLAEWLGATNGNGAPERR